MGGAGVCSAVMLRMAKELPLAIGKMIKSTYNSLTIETIHTNSQEDLDNWLTCDE